VESLFLTLKLTALVEIYVKNYNKSRNNMKVLKTFTEVLRNLKDLENFLKSRVQTSKVLA
jgi:hypothetical protein